MDVLPPLLVGYLLGSLPLGYLIARGVRGVDLRRVGSGNVGAANVLRTGGLGAALAVMAVDIAKGAGAVLWAGPGSLGVVAGLAAIVGHVYPVWLGFRGGKGVATATGVFGVAAPLATFAAAVTFCLVVAGTRRVSAGSIAAVVVLPAAEWLTTGAGAPAVAATVAGGLILFRHRGNMARLWFGTERALGA